MIKNMWDKFIVWGYERYGLIDGDNASYGYYDWITNFLFIWFETQYVALGYLPIHQDDWQSAGGYGMDHTLFLRVKKNDNPR